MFANHRIGKDKEVYSMKFMKAKKVRNFSKISNFSAILCLIGSKTANYFMLKTTLAGKRYYNYSLVIKYN